jgi:tetratricopeptide (TPR) repeat protein
MKFGSLAALGLVLAVGGVSATATEAFAKDKAPKAAKPQPISKGLIPSVQVAQKAIIAKQYPEALAAIAAGEANAVTPYDKYVVASLRLNIATEQKDRPAQISSVYAIIASGGMPAADVGKLNYYAGQFSFEDKKYADALRYFAVADQANYPDKSYLITVADANFKLGNFAAGSTALEKAIVAETAAGRKPAENWYAFAITQANKAKLPAESARWTASYIKAYPTPVVWNKALATYRDTGKLDPQIQLDVFRLMHDAKGLSGAQDYYDYAAVATERGLPGEAKTIIIEGYDSGAVSRTIPQIKERLVDAEAKIGPDRAALPGLETKSAASADGKLASSTGNAFLAYGENAKALSFYDMALKKGGTIDVNAVNLRRGIALSRLGRKPEARTAFQTVGGPQKDLAGFWLIFLDTNP